MPARKTLFAVTLLGATSSFSIAAAQNAPPAGEEDVSVSEVVIVGRNVIAKLDEIAGNASVISADQLESGRVANIADALRYQPGLLAQTSNGTEQTRFSMRGSGIIRSPNAWGTGIQMLQAGLPLTTPEGSPYEYYEPLANNYIEVYRGANAFEYSPTTQGGALNYVPHTGYDAARLLLRAEAGSYGYRRAQVSSGQVIGPFDYYVSATKFDNDGFRNRNQAESFRVVSNIGYVFADDLRGRFHLTFAQQNTENASALNWTQLKANPRRNNTVAGNRRNPGSWLAGGTLTWEPDASSSLEFGAIYKNYPLRNQGGSFPGHWDVKDAGASIRYTREHTLFGRDSETVAAVLHTFVLPDSTSTTYNAAETQLLNKVYYRGHDTTLLLKNDLALTDRLWLTTGLAVIDQSRESNITYPNQDHIRENYTNVAPRLGARLDITPTLQAFGNVSRSVEAPIAHQLPQTRNNIYAFNASIQEQTQDTYEVGLRHRGQRFDWDIVAYHARIKGEILSVQIEPATPTTPAVVQTSNAQSPTIHRGIEASLLATVLERGGFELRTRQTLTLNDFHYDGDPLFGDNDLPAVPKNIYQGGLELEHESGLYAGIDIEATFSKYAADFANTIYARPYTIVNARIGWQTRDKSWQVFVDGRNLGDKVYAAVVAPTFDAKGADSAVYTPGVGRAISVGLSRAF